ncbi:uncharacterized protein BDV17DRAFT_288060 [Aspergillus undulatus]|uniref:uncharacterized protein n=1 Tax=Aspergillus undulatus TaxID=1810928 RepID=UPI003CCE054F
MAFFHDASKKGTDALKQYVATKYQSAGWMDDEPINGMMDAEGSYASEIVQVRLPSLYKERFLLVGDAGYAGAAGAGTSLAFVGAQGAGGYNERMGPLVEDLQKTPSFLSTIDLVPFNAANVPLAGKQAVVGDVFAPSVESNS